MVTWNGDTSQDYTANQHVWFRIYNSSGNATIDPQWVDTNSTYSDTHASVTAVSGGGFVIAWTGNERGTYDVYQQEFNASGQKVGIPVMVNTTGGSKTVSSDPDIRSLQDGGWIVAWQSNGNVYQQRYLSSGLKYGGESRVNTTKAGSEWNAQKITELRDGGWVVTWEGGVAGNYNIYQQRYNSAGIKVGGEQLVNSSTGGNEAHPRIEALDDGGWIVTWEGNVSGNYNVYQQRFDRNGYKVPVQGNYQFASTEPDGDAVTIVDDDHDTSGTADVIVAQQEEVVPHLTVEETALAVASSAMQSDAAPSVQDGEGSPPLNETSDAASETDADIAPLGQAEDSTVIKDVCVTDDLAGPVQTSGMAGESTEGTHGDLAGLDGSDQPMNFDQLDQRPDGDNCADRPGSIETAEVVLDEHDLLDYKESIFVEFDLGRAESSLDPAVDDQPDVPGDCPPIVSGEEASVAFEQYSSVYEISSSYTSDARIDDIDRFFG